MGVKDGRIPNSRLTSSSVWPSNSVSMGRLDFELVAGAWLAAEDDSDPWVKIDLGKPSYVTGVIVQGRNRPISPYYRQWVTSVYISHSLDDIDWVFALEQECGTKKVYAANFDFNSHVTLLFPGPINARYVRIHPITHHEHPSMRFEVLGGHNITTR
ncbi:lactadherin-like [Lytechinus variegatus]|uniref:lactadherin-like n=1 Tax=Lytechinus variegatus TaxID=7654 RepID=UPI001BB155B1|nr:lactadherin-like [Lytechinus variegatus]